MRSTHNPSSKTHNFAEKHTFSSKERDAETGLSYFGAHRTAARMEFKAWGTFEAGAADYYPGKSKLNPTDQQRCINYLNYGKY